MNLTNRLVTASLRVVILFFIGAACLPTGLTQQASARTTLQNCTNNTPPVIISAPGSITVSEGVPVVIGVIGPNTFSPLADYEIKVQMRTHTFTYFSTGVRLLLDGNPIRARGDSLTSYYDTFFTVTVGKGAHFLQLILKDSCGVEATRVIPINVVGASKSCVYPAFAPAKTITTTNTFSALASGDFNRDGRADIAVADTTAQTIKIYLGQVNGDLLATSPITISAEVTSLFVDDVTRDGRLDLLVVHKNQSNSLVSIYTGNGSGGFALLRTYAVSGERVSLGDYDKNGSVDFVAVLDTGSLQIFFNSGTGAFVERAQNNLGERIGGSSVATGYYDTDDNLDILVEGRSGGFMLGVFLGNGDGTFRFSLDISSFSLLARNMEIIVSKVFAADFGGVSRPRFAFQFSKNTFGSDVQPKIQDASFAYPSKWIYGFAPTALSVADINGDRKMDVVFNTGQVALSSTTASLCALPQLLPQIGLIASADVNGDGRIDVVSAASNVGLQVFLNRSNTAVTVSAANYVGDTLAPEQIIAAFGVNLSQVTQAARTLPLPTLLAGVQVRVLDSLGQARVAPLFFVSSGQVNFMVPAGTASGTASIEIIGDNGTYSAGVAEIASLAPGLFTINANGQGLASAQVLRVNASGALRYEAIARLNASNQWEAIPIDLSNLNEQVFLILYGTGLRGRAANAPVLAKIGGLDAEVLYAGAQGSLAGLDQVNLRMPRALAGRGVANVSLVVDGKTLNTVQINVK